MSHARKWPVACRINIKVKNLKGKPGARAGGAAESAWRRLFYGGGGWRWRLGLRVCLGLRGLGLGCGFVPLEGAA